MNRHVESRLKKELVVWLGTVGRDARPHATLVWFLWDGESFLVYSVPGQKVRDIEGNPHVALHLNSDALGAEMVRASGSARISRKEPPAHKVPAYLRKYHDHIEALGMTPEQFAAQYHVAIRIRPERFH